MIACFFVSSIRVSAGNDGVLYFEQTAAGM
jgi:hypothetical protein